MCKQLRFKQELKTQDTWKDWKHCQINPLWLSTEKVHPDWKAGWTRLCNNSGWQCPCCYRWSRTCLTINSTHSLRKCLCILESSARHLTAGVRCTFSSRKNVFVVYSLKSATPKIIKWMKHYKESEKKHQPCLTGCDPLSSITLDSWKHTWQ